MRGVNAPGREIFNSDKRTRQGEFPSNNNHLATMETPDENPPKRAKLSEPPKHGQRLFFNAMLYWFDSQNQRVGNEVMLLLDSGCSGPILNQNFV